MPDNVTILNSAGATTSMRTSLIDGIHVPHHIVEKFPTVAVDSFGRLRTSDPGYRLDAQLTYRINTDVWDTKTTGTATVTHDANERWAALSADASGANSAILQTHYHAPYTPGRSQLAFITFLMGVAPETDGWKRVGYYDGTNGVYLERLTGAVNLVCKSSTTHGTETVPQASWNIDVMDGTGPSGLILDLTSVQILVISMQALYVGRVIVGFDIGGELIPVHEFTCANEEAYPYIAQASLPVRYEVGATAATGTAPTMKAICCSVISEGGNDLPDIAGRTFTASNKLTYRTVNSTTSYPILAIKCIEQLNSIDQNTLVVPTSAFVSMTGTNAWVDVILRPTTLTKAAGEPTWVAVDATSSTAHYTVDADAVTGGTVIGGFQVLATNTTRDSKELGLLGKLVMAYSHLLAKGDQLVLAVTTGGNGTASGQIEWKEVR